MGVGRKLGALAGLVAALSIGITGGTIMAQGSDFTDSVIYQIVTDRFYDGNPNNDNPSSSPNLYDPTHTNWYLY